MAIEEDIIKAVNANLTAEVSGRLKIRLQQAEDLERRNLLIEAELKDVKSKLQMSEKQLHEVVDLGNDIKKLESARDQARAAAVDKQIVDLKIQHCTERVNDMKELVKAVFANNQYKYMLQENGTGVVTANPNTYPATIPTTRTVTATGEGAPPPAPGQP
jgi:hypothetical protein